METIVLYLLGIAILFMVLMIAIVLTIEYLVDYYHAKKDLEAMTATSTPVVPADQATQQDLAV